MLDGECRQTYIREAPLMEAVREAAEKQIQLLGTLRGQWMRQIDMVGTGEERQDTAEIGMELQSMKMQEKIEEEIRLIKKQKQGLYEDLKKGLLNQEDFEGEWERLTGCQAQCEKKIREMGYIATAEKEAMEVIQKYPKNFFELKSGDIPLSLLVSLIEKIIVVSQEQIEITYAFSDIVAKWCEEAQH